jgi:14-3-3 protein epsilon
VALYFCECPPNALQPQDDLFPFATEAESKVEYAKMQGDYYRYMCEYTDQATREDAINNAAAFYQTAFDVSMELAPGNATRLGLCLNFSVLYYEIMGKQEEAKKMAEDALRDSNRDTADENAESIISLLEVRTARRFSVERVCAASLCHV